MAHLLGHDLLISQSMSPAVLNGKLSMNLFPPLYFTSEFVRKQTTPPNNSFNFNGAILHHTHHPHVSHFPAHCLPAPSARTSVRLLRAPLIEIQRRACLHWAGPVITARRSANGCVLYSYR